MSARRAVTVPSLLAAICLIAGVASFVEASEGEWDLSAAVGAEFRWFPEDPQFPSQFEGVQPSLQLVPEVTWESEGRRHEFAVTAFLRVDGRDDERTHFDLREAYYRHVGSRWEVLAGVGRVFWGVTESRHLVDVINQDDFVEDIDREDKLGQPMINFGLQPDWGRIDVFALVGFRQPTFPGVEGRLRFPLPVDSDAAIWESAAEDRRVDFAARYSHFVGDWDFGMYVFKGTGREPRLQFDFEDGHAIPHYDVILQGGTDVQYTKGAWLSKLEAIVREGQGKTFAAGVAGVEYSFYQAFGSSIDVGLLFEYLYDGRDETAPLTVFDDDLFFGSRLGFNDTQDTALLLGTVIDRNDGSTSGRLELERRITPRLLLEVESRWFTRVEPPNPLTVFERDSFVTVRLTTFF
jgi:hypothetical protein